ncbi:uncharacterized protein LOC116176752 [Photinus pyralis]|uniref:uncharacterized protein LOC116176752 n=1 Tax=Photinus pyralis TaxID=7054 RepID=UPI001266FF2D|nr:uncharacterized protein LOC116176752 [Photinus pyralis]
MNYSDRKRLDFYDPENKLTFTIHLSEEEHHRASTDVTYATKLFARYKSRMKENAEMPLRDIESIQVDNVVDGVWSEQETQLLISLYADHLEDFTHAKKKKFVWDIISEKMCAYDYKRTAAKIERKWINLVRVYRSIKDNKGPKKSGRGTQSYKYFQSLDDILGDKPSNNSDVLSVEVGVVNQTQTQQHAEHTLGNTPQTSKRRSGSNEYYMLAKQRRHEERMEMERQKLEVEKSKTELLKEILEKLQGTDST